MNSFLLCIFFSFFFEVWRQAGKNIALVLAAEVLLPSALQHSITSVSQDGLNTKYCRSSVQSPSQQQATSKKTWSGQHKERTAKSVEFVASPKASFFGFGFLGFFEVFCGVFLLFVFVFVFCFCCFLIFVLAFGFWVLGFGFFFGLLFFFFFKFEFFILIAFI